ncbi:hypothetical protein LCGC14_2596490 [marine sediment metagenome]|uniref:Restriction alleviation protein, Lar family n=1 Tax=marine sediment metagenome TaxID=412755 RepID=A0A0F9D2R9_9ZZZZ
MTEQLKPCPFCGGKGSMSKDYCPDGGGAFHFIQCSKCRAKGAEFYATETCPIFYGQVRDAWNRRAALTVTPQEAAKVLLDHYGYDWPDDACDAISANQDGNTAYQLIMALRAISEDSQ